jgi:hypothetical protein
MGMFVPCVLKGDRCRLAQDPDSSGLKGTANLGSLLWSFGQIIGRKKKDIRDHRDLQNMMKNEQNLAKPMDLRIHAVAI